MDPDSVYQECLSLREYANEHLDQSGYEVCKPCTNDTKSLDLPEVTNQNVVNSQLKRERKSRSQSPPSTHCQASQTVKKTKPQVNCSLVISLLALVVSITSLILVVVIHIPLNQQVYAFIENVQTLTNAEIEDLKFNQSNFLETIRALNLAIQQVDAMFLLKTFELNAKIEDLTSNQSSTLESIRALSTAIVRINASIEFRINQELQYLKSNLSSTELLFQNLQNTTVKRIQFLNAMVENLAQYNNSLLLNEITFSGEIRGFEPYAECVTSIERTCTILTSTNRCETVDLDYIQTGNDALNYTRDAKCLQLPFSVDQHHLSTTLQIQGNIVFCVCERLISSSSLRRAEVSCGVQVTRCRSSRNIPVQIIASVASQQN